MKINRMATHSQAPAPEADGTTTHGHTELLQVSQAMDTAPDRRRSRQQEMEEIQAKAIGPFEGQEQILESAREVAEKLASLGPGAAGRVLAEHSISTQHVVDAKA